VQLPDSVAAVIDGRLVLISVVCGEVGCLLRCLVVRCIVFTDDSGLREGAMQGLAGVMGHALAADPVAFAAR
jgi:hypothetical protein